MAAVCLRIKNQKDQSSMHAAMRALPMAASHVKRLRDDTGRKFKVEIKLLPALSTKREWRNEAIMFNFKEHVIKCHEYIHVTGRQL